MDPVICTQVDLGRRNTPPTRQSHPASHPNRQTNKTGQPTISMLKLRANEHSASQIRWHFGNIAADILKNTSAVIQRYHWAAKVSTDTFATCLNKYCSPITQLSVQRPCKLLQELTPLLNIFRTWQALCFEFVTGGVWGGVRHSDSQGAFHPSNRGYIYCYPQWHGCNC